MRLSLVIACLAASAAAADPVFIDRTADLPVEHTYSGGWEHFVGGGVAILDCNGDDLPDLFVAGGEGPARLFVNESTSGGPIRFGLGTVDALTGVTGAYPLDIDGDGPLDLAILRVGANRIWRGTGACGFTDATETLGLQAGDRWTTAFTATWEGGGLPTLVFGNYVDRTDPKGPFEACDVNEIHRPNGRGYGAPTLLEPGFCALSMLISDWRRRGAPALRLSNDRHYYVRGGYEQMYDLHENRFLGEEDGWRRVSLWGMGIASRDISGDGIADVMLTSMGDQLLQFTEPDGTMRDAPFALGATAHRPHIGDDGRPSTGWHAEFADVDNDGRDDLFISKGNVEEMPSNAIRDPNNLLLAEGDGTFREVSVAAGVASDHRSRGAGLVDLNLDGRLDLVVVNRRAPLQVWENTSAAGNWLSVDLRAPGPNTRAVGAWIELKLGDRVMAREVTVGGGHASGHAGPQHFGLGAADGAELRVIWPDGHTGPWQRVRANSRIVLHPDGTRDAG